MKSECQWLDKVIKMTEKGLLDKEDSISWSAHFALLQAQALRSHTITALLPFWLKCSYNAYDPAFSEDS